MTTLRQAAQQALEALLLCDSKDAGKAMAAITFLRAALAQQEQEPVAWLKTMYSGTRPMLEVDHLRKATSTPVYTHPPRREWCSLSEEEIIDAVRESDLDWQRGWTLEDSEPNRYTQLARAIEAKLKEKNT